MSENNLTRRQFIAGAGAAAVTLPFIDLRASASSERPNFVFILTDDQRYDAMSCAGHPFLSTPNIDRIANEGARFTNAFVTTSLCAPSRSSFLTGQYVHRTGIRGNGYPLKEDMPTCPQILQKAGYDTAHIGKWHLGDWSPRPGYNHWVSFQGLGLYRGGMLDVDGKRVPQQGYLTDELTDYAVRWLRKPRQEPFMLWLAHKAVHGPFQPAWRHSKLYSDAKITRPANMFTPGHDEPKWLAKRRPTGHGVGDGARFDNFIRNYNRVISGIDSSVGRVLSTLEELGVMDNTVIVFAGDNGYFQGEHGLTDKRAMYEESIRIPMLMRYPKLAKPGTLVDDMVLNIDLCPTMLDLAGQAIPQVVQGKSVRPTLRGHARHWREDFLYEYWQERGFMETPSIRGVRTAQWKYVEYPGADDTNELYDIKHDPTEMNNLINSPAHAGRLAEMKARLERLSTETA